MSISYNSIIFLVVIVGYGRRCFIIQSLEGIRFLLVLDDLWNENISEWHVLRSPFSVGLHGSKILVTTRNSVVSSTVATIDPHYLQPLSDEDYWELIAQRTLSNRSLDGKEKLVAIGEKIAEKCGGSPLAAKTIGSVLPFKLVESEWEALLESKLWDLPEYKTVFPALRLSYNYLSAPLKRCFVYCSIFPHNYEFEKDDLVHLWMAEGFIQPQGLKTLAMITSITCYGGIFSMFLILIILINLCIICMVSFMSWPN